jgi:hypothetical protein
MVPAIAATASAPLTFEQYVALCAELTVFPDRSALIAARAGLTEPAMSTLHAEWRVRFASDADLMQQWHQLYPYYCDWYAKNKGT